MIPVEEQQLLSVAKNAHLVYRKAFADADAVLARHGINANARRLTHFLAQILHETGGFRVLTESIDYAVDALLAMYVRVKRPRMTEAQARALGRLPPRKANQVEIANLIYGGEFGRKQLGNIAPGDGWLYRGHGLPQLTGRANFQRFGKLLGIDLESNPALALDARYALELACRFWSEARAGRDRRPLNAIADEDDYQYFGKSDPTKSPALLAITTAWNGGTNGLAKRAEFLVKCRGVWPA
jgi:predicted chitinase